MHPRQRSTARALGAARNAPRSTLQRVLLSSLVLVGAALAWASARAETPSVAPAQAAVPASSDASRMRLSSAQVQQAFRYIDRDGDGRLSRAEIAAFPRVEKHFERIDTDHDGTVSPAEFESALQQAS